MTRVKQFGFADGRQHALGGRGVNEWIALAGIEVFLDRHLFFTRLLVTVQKTADDIHATS